MEYATVLMNHVSPLFPDAVPGALKTSVPVDMNRTIDQWTRFGDTIESHCNVPVKRLRINENKPDGRYLEDLGRELVVRNGSPKKLRLLLSLPYGHPVRKAERAEAEAAILEHAGEFDEVIRIDPELNGDGGDLYFMPHLPKPTLFLGYSGRTDRPFHEDVRRKLARFDIRVEVAPLRKVCLHIITASSPISREQVCFHRPYFESGAVRVFRGAGADVVYNHNDEPHGANFFLANSKLIGNAHAPRSVELVEKAVGQEVARVENDESWKRHGSFTCDTFGLSR